MNEAKHDHKVCSRTVKNAASDSTQLTPATKVPQYARIAAVKAMAGANQADIERQSALELEQVFLLAINKRKDSRVPARKMPKDDFIDWCLKEYALAGKPLEGIDWTPEGELDWSTDVGFIVLVPSDHGEFYDAMHCPSMDIKQPLPKGMTIPFHQVPSLWRMEENFHLSTVMLVKDTRPREAYHVGELFGAQAVP